MDIAAVDMSRGNEILDLHLPGWRDKQKQVSAARVSMLEWVRSTSRSFFFEIPQALGRYSSCLELIFPLRIEPREEHARQCPRCSVNA